MKRPLARFAPSRQYVTLTLASIGGALLSGWIGTAWTPAFLAAMLFALTALVLGLMTFRPVIEIYDTHLQVGERIIPWDEIRSVEQTSWNVPLAVRIGLASGSTAGESFILFYAGNLDSSSSLLRHLRRSAREALLDGVPYRQYWGEPIRPRNVAASELPRYPLLRPEDEEEVERMFQRLKTAGKLDARGSDDQ